MSDRAVLSDIKPGAVVELQNKNFGSMGAHIVTGDPMPFKEQDEYRPLHVNQANELTVMLMELNPRYPQYGNSERMHFLSDMGVVPYGGTHYNEANHTELLCAADEPVTRWQDAEPGVARANLVKAPYKPSTDQMDGVHYDYIRTFHYEDGMERGIFVKAFDERVREFPQDGTFSIHFIHNDDRPFSRVISATRVETAVENQTFMDICDDEHLVVTHADNAGWLVMEALEFYANMMYGASNTALCGTSKTSLRDAYLDYHSKA